LEFVNFENIFMGIFDAPTRVAEPSEATRPPDETEAWRTFLFCEQEWTVYDLRSAFETIKAYSLIQWKPDRRSYTMHKLVHAWGQDRLETNRQRQLSGLAPELMADASAQGKLDPSRQLRSMPHVMASLMYFLSCMNR